MTDVEAIEEGLRAIGRLLADGFLEELKARQPVVQRDTKEDSVASDKFQTAGQGEEYMDAAHLADLLSLPPASVRRLARTGAIPSIRVGRRTLRFDVGEVMAVLKESPE